MAVLVNAPPCVLHEDDHLLVVNKPPGLNTHSPSLYAGEGIYDWLRNREPRWVNLAIIHRLDKTTSGLIVFAKSKLANQSLTHQFTDRKVHKRYLLLTTAAPAEKSFTVRSGILRSGERYIAGPHGEPAETKFTLISETSAGGARFTAPDFSQPESRSASSAATQPDPPHHFLSAEPLTGRTHQIRVHAELHRIPILGDTTYGGAPFHRVCLHAAELSFTHPATGTPVTFRAEPDFFSPPHLALRAALVEPSLTNTFRVLHSAADARPGLYVDRWGDFLLAQSDSDSFDQATGETRRSTASEFFLSSLPVSPTSLRPSTPSLYFKPLNKEVVRTTPQESQPKLISGPPAPDPFTILENGVRYEISFQQGYSVGLFLDQRDNRRRFLKNYVGPNFELFSDGLSGKEILNTFAYTCGFSVCAALAGARTTSLDLSKKYLEWGKRNFTLNKLDPSGHDFIYGDLFEWAPRLAKKGRQFDLIILDPPTFSRSKIGGVFQAEKNYGKLITAILPLLRKNGVLFASTNAHKLAPENFLAQIRTAVAAAHRPILQEQYIPQPPDFPISREEPAYLKTVWVLL